MQPAGVQGRKHSSPMTMRPTFTGVKPSTSLSGEMASMTRFSRICPGSGSCTSTPWTVLSAFSAAIFSRSAASVVSSGSAMTSDSRPHSAQSFALPATYVLLAGFSPTITTARRA